MHLATRWKFVVAAAVVAVVGVLGYYWLQAATDSYDQRYSDCMRVKEATLNPQGHYFPDDVYNEAMRDCEHRAGVPTEQTTPLHPLNERPPG